MGVSFDLSDTCVSFGIPTMLRKLVKEPYSVLPKKIEHSDIMK